MLEAAPPLLCPRCGYDVSGPVPTWQDSCPLEGTCSECGLRFEWVDLFRPERIYPPWSFEHARQRRIRAFLSTSFRSLLPGRFWTRLRMSAPIRPARLILLAILCCLACHLAAVAIGYEVFKDYLWTTTWRFPQGLGPTAARVSAQTFSWPAFGRVAAWPYQFTWAAGWSSLRLIGPLGQLGLLWGLLAPLPYFILEQTMATAKVRKLHLLRGALCFIPTLAALLLLDIAFLAAPRLFGGWAWNSPGFAAWNLLGIALFLLAAAWIIRWWLIFTRTYLHLPRPKAVVAAMMTIAFLAALISCLLTDEQLRQPIGHALNSLVGWNAH